MTTPRRDEAAPSRRRAHGHRGPRASCSSTRPSASAPTSRASATTPAWSRWACAACAWSRSTAARGRHPAAGLLHRVHRRHGGRHRPRGSRRRRTACSSSCWSTTRSTARSATRAASARCRTRPWRTGRARAASSRRSATSRSRSPIADLVLLDRERCIQCARCTRFADEVAGEAQIDFAAAARRSRWPPSRPSPFSSYFSGNTVQICPVGALTATPYRFTRPALGPRPGRVHLHRAARWAAGCGAVLAEPADPAARHRLRPGQPRLAVRQGPLRLRVGQRRRGRRRRASEWPTRPSTWRDRVPGGQAWPAQFLGEARTAASTRAPGRSGAAPSAGARPWRRRVRPPRTGGRRGGLIGGARLTNESAYAWAKLAKGVIGTDRSTPSSATGCPPTWCSACPGPPSTRPAPRRPVLA